METAELGERVKVKQPFGHGSCGRQCQGLLGREQHCRALPNPELWVVSAMDWRLLSAITFLGGLVSLQMAEAPGTTAGGWVAP